MQAQGLRSSEYKQVSGLRTSYFVISLVGSLMLLVLGSGVEALIEAQFLAVAVMA